MWWGEGRKGVRGGVPVPSILLFMYSALEAKAKDENKVNSL